MKIRFLSLAHQEVNDAVRWYEEQAEGLGRDFLDELDRVVRLVKSYPLMATRLRLKSGASCSLAFLIR
jgi:hypothetical protein